MPSTTLTRTYRIPAPPVRVVEHLARPSSYVGLSPLIIAVRDVREEDGTIFYVAVEQFRFLGLLRYDNALHVSLRTNVTGMPLCAEVSGLVRSPGGVSLDYRFEISRESNSGSVVVDTLTLRAPFGLLGFAASQVRAVQAARGGILAERFS